MSISVMRCLVDPAERRARDSTWMYREITRKAIAKLFLRPLAFAKAGVADRISGRVSFVQRVIL